MKTDTTKQPMSQEPAATPTQPLWTFVDAVIIPALLQRLLAEATAPKAA